MYSYGLEPQYSPLLSSESDLTPSDMDTNVSQLPEASQHTLGNAYKISHLLSSQGIHAAVAMAQPLISSSSEAVVVKMFKAGPGDDLLTQEADITKRLTKSTGVGRPHIIPLILQDTSLPCAWFSMPLVHGCQLGEFIKSFDTNNNPSTDGDGATRSLIPPTIISLLPTDFLNARLTPQPRQREILHSPPPTATSSIPELRAYLPKVILMDFGAARLSDVDHTQDAFIRSQLDIEDVGLTLYSMAQRSCVDVTWVKRIFWDAGGLTSRQILHEYEAWAAAELDIGITLQVVEQIVDLCEEVSQ
ncbi:hypothetical protein EJ08DRAFT_734487 [Tothia fuscella]|uniref:Protein kinase domain-containing protein n=1 Tax=Tothia fuscella TaxID=1048955 RepID=A0A9P4NQQ3_9PEZI|nr:hypothetical protein EJ08DRAFT_734487 [Tothia fuscella]